MKIAISANKPDVDADVDPRFGRCQYFIIVDPESMEFESIENTGSQAGGGAGVGTVQVVADKGIDTIITGNCGPNAFKGLSTSGMKVITGVSGKVKDTIDDFKTGKLQPASQPSVSGHFGTRNIL